MMGLHGPPVATEALEASLGRTDDGVSSGQLEVRFGVLIVVLCRFFVIDGEGRLISRSLIMSDCLVLFVVLAGLGVFEALPDLAFFVSRTCFPSLTDLEKLEFEVPLATRSFALLRRVVTILHPPFELVSPPPTI